jgi:3,4-dihydroxy 2-butanone 4-phosphate synthase/GTP cyclohydrolase II
MSLAPIDAILEDARAGRMFVLVDDEQRENEGDLVIPACFADAQAINFMAKYGRGLICLTLTQTDVERLHLPLMPRHNSSRHQTAFTVSIEAREGVTTGISAADRACTITTAINPAFGPEAIVTPGHIFPLLAREGGVLVRAGHTEAAVDIARLAGVHPSGVICEIMKDDGTMARLPDLLEFAETHALKVGTIADLIAYRLRYDRLVERLHSTPFHDREGAEWNLTLYRSSMDGVEHLALTQGVWDADEPVLVRMHALDILRDVLGEANGNTTSDLSRAMQAIRQQSKGAVVLIRDSERPNLLQSLTQTERVKAPGQLRDYGVGAQILRDLGIRKLRLLTNTSRAIVGLEGYALEITEQVGF